MVPCMRVAPALLFGLLLGVLLAACDSTGVGSPCDKDADCDDGLICDVHDDAGTCQEPHGHDTDSGTDTEHDTEHDTETETTG